MLAWLANAWRVPELRRRLLFTAAMLAAYRLGSFMPAPGVDSQQIENFFNGKGGSLLGLLNLFSGSALSRFSIFALGIMPYVTASIILQLLTVVIPQLEQLQKEGESGYAKINQYTRYLTVVLAAAQATGYAYLFHKQGALSGNPGRLVLIIVTLTAGTTLLMWIGELITKRGIGNGISLLIFASILTSAPQGINAWINGGPMERLFFPLIAIGIVVSVVFVQEGQRRIPIQYAKQMMGRRQTAGGSTYMPLRVNMAGVIPVIFAAALLALPQTVGSFVPSTQHLDQHALRAALVAVPPDRGAADHRLHLLLHGGPVQPGRPGRQPAQVRRLHPRHPPGPADRAVPRPRADAADAARARCSWRPSPSRRRSSSRSSASRRRPAARSAAPRC